MRFTDYLALAFRSVRRSRLRSALTVGAIVIGATCTSRASPVASNFWTT